jgi:hypothetical protein
MKYALEILERTYRDERQFRIDALRCLCQGVQSESDTEALDESIRLANERMPELKAAITVLKQSPNG